MGSFRPAHKVARTPAHHSLDHHVHPTRVDGGSESEIDPATRSDPGELEKEAEEDRKAEAPRPPRTRTRLPITLPAKIFGREFMDTRLGMALSAAMHNDPKPLSDYVLIARFLITS